VASLLTQPLEIGNFQVAPLPIFAQDFYATTHATIAYVDFWSGDQFFYFVLALAAK
jgi:hypothetical protein